MIGLRAIAAADEALGAVAAGRLRAVIGQRGLRARQAELEAALAAQALTRRRDAAAAQEELLQRLLRAAGYRDDNTHEHTQRVADLAARLARELGAVRPPGRARPSRGAAARHRQDRDPGLDPAQAWTFDRGGIRGRQDPRRARRAGAPRRRLRRHPDGRGDRPPPPRALGRRRLSRRPGRRRDPDRRRGSCTSPTSSTCSSTSAPTRTPGRSRRRSPRSSAGRARTSIRRSSRAFLRSIDA